MKKYFVLQIKDNDIYDDEEECIYASLLYDDFDECKKAAHLVRELNKKWYDREDDSMAFDEFIIEGLKEANLYGHEIGFYSCYVR